MISCSKATAVLSCVLFAGLASAAEWEGYERLAREALLARIADAPRGAKPDIKAKNLIDADLSKVDFRGADSVGVRHEWREARRRHARPLQSHGQFSGRGESLRRIACGRR